MADLGQALRDSVDGMASEARAHVKQVDVYSKAEECRAYCATKGRGLEYILKEEACLCQQSRHELLRRGANALRPRQRTTALSPDQMAAFGSCGGDTACLASVSSSVANSQAEAATATATTTADDSASTTSGRIEASETALTTGEGTNDSSASPSVPTASNGATSTPSTTSSNSAVSGYPSADGLGGATPTSVKQSNNSGGLSQGSKIGLGIGLGVGLAVLIAAIVLFCLARRRKRRSAPMGGKYARAQSDVSMVEAPYPTAAAVAGVRETPKEYQEPPQYEPPRYSQYERDNEPVGDHREAVEEVDDRASEEFEPPRNVFQTPRGQSPVTPLALAIPSAADGPSTPHSRDLSPAGGGSPVSPISPVSAVSPINSRPSSPTRHH